VDAIYIHQQDLAVRSAEVIKMGMIYKRAAQVLVWLGPSTDNNGLAVQTLDNIGKSLIILPQKSLITKKRGA
jgi:hypothetical protein